MRHHLHLPRVSPRARSLSIILPLLLTLSACGAASAADPDPVVDDQPIETTTTTVDPYAVPETIDLAYVTKVIQEIENVRDGMRRDIVASNDYSPADSDKLNAIYAEPALSFQVDFWSQPTKQKFSNLKPNPGNDRVWAKELIEVHPDCIWARVGQDSSANVVKVNSTGDVDIVLVKKSINKTLNPTPWVEKQLVPVSLDVVEHGERACG